MMTTFTFLAEETNGGYDYTVTVEETTPGLVRFNIEAKSQAPSGFNNSQGVDLIGAECAAIGKHLLALAERLDRVR